MTVEQYEILAKYEMNLHTALYADYFRNMTSKAYDEIDDIYFDLFKEHSQIKTGCGHCVLSSLKKIAKAYFDYKDNRLDNDYEEKPKRTRKPKAVAE